MLNFAVIGVGGYIAPKHLRAIKETGHRLVAACDVTDSVGVLDQYFQGVQFFKAETAFWTFLYRQKVDYLVVCSPNHCHTQHVCTGLEMGANVICEKPLALTAAELDKIEAKQASTGKKVSTILQLRYHPSVLAIKEQVAKMPNTQVLGMELQYITPRGPWYHVSWKGDVEKSGGIITNIGIHLFDMLLWMFGTPIQTELTTNSPQKASGILSFPQAQVQWHLSIDYADLAPYNTDKPVRFLRMDDQRWDFSEGFGDLHTESYHQILSGNGWNVDTVRPSVELAEQLRYQ